MSSSGQGAGQEGDRSDSSGSKPSFFRGLRERSLSRLRKKFSSTSLDQIDPTESSSAPPVPQLPQAPIPTTTDRPSAVTDGKASIEPRAEAKFVGGRIAPFKDLDPHMAATTAQVRETKSLSYWSDSTPGSPSSPESASHPASPATVRSVETFGNLESNFARPGSLSTARASRSAAPDSATSPTDTRVSGSVKDNDPRRHTFGGSPYSDE